MQLDSVGQLFFLNGVPYINLATAGGTLVFAMQAPTPTYTPQSPVQVFVIDMNDADPQQ